MRTIHQTEVDRFLATAPESPSPLQAAILHEASGHPERLILVGWKCLATYCSAVETEIECGRRTAPPAPPFTSEQLLERLRELRADVAELKNLRSRVFRPYQ